DLFQQPLVCISLQAAGKRKINHGMDQAMVQKRYSAFDGGRHAHPVQTTKQRSKKIRKVAEHSSENYALAVFRDNLIGVSAAKEQTLSSKVVKKIRRVSQETLILRNCRQRNAIACSRSEGEGLANLCGDIRGPTF